MKMTKLKLVVVVAVSCSALFCGGYEYGYHHKAKPTIRERLEAAFESGQGFSRGWQACEDTYSIKWVDGRGWVCGRFDAGCVNGITNMPKYVNLQ